MLYRVRRHLNSFWFNRGTRGILDTPPVRCDSHSAVTFVSQVCHLDVFMYLVALKSLTRFLAPRRVVALDDGSLTMTDRSWLIQQVPGLKLMRITEIHSDSCPSGGCWERLLFIATTVGDEYVLQIDADTLTLKSPREVLRCVSENQSFTLGTKMGPAIIPMTDRCAAAKGHVKAHPEEQHVQSLAEMHFDQLRGFHHLRYVRGNAGFAGYAKGSFTREVVRDFSAQMWAILGQQKWAEWGSEQVASNFVVANSPNAEVLPFSRYAYFEPSLEVERCAFIHFIGEHRFKRGTYRKLASSIVGELRGASIN